MDVNKEHKIDEKIVAAMHACIDHARALLASAQAVQAAGHPNIAYHLTTLALEEIGRRELIGVQSISSKSPIPPAWPEKHTQDHIKKLFWCFFGGNNFSASLTGSGVEAIDKLVRNIHFKRLAGLYVDHFAKICGHFETKKLDGVVVTLKEVAFIKIVCDTYFLRKISGARIRSQPKASIDGDPC